MKHYERIAIHGYRTGRSFAAGDITEFLGWAIFEHGMWVRTELA
jgi:hypothetical protein